MSVQALADLITQLLRGELHIDGVSGARLVNFQDREGFPSRVPCSLVNYAEKTLDLNARNGLIRKLAEVSQESHDDDRDRDATTKEMTRLMVETGVLPTSVPFSHLGAAGEHGTGGSGTGVDGGSGRRRPRNDEGGGCCIILSNSIGGKPCMIDDEFVARLTERDVVLGVELDHLIGAGTGRSQVSGDNPNEGDLAPPHDAEGQAEPENVSDELISYSPQFATYVLGTPPPMAATNKLFAVSLFFGAPIVDRTETLRDPDVRVQVLDKIPKFDPSFRKPLAQICDERARAIFDMVRAPPGEGQTKKKLVVLWSGGIDSTAALIALMRVGTPEEVSRIVIRFRKEAAVDEYRLFYHTFIEGKFAEEPIDEDGEVADTIEREDEIIVTGECGDQLFGSALMTKCFEGQFGVPEREDRTLPNRFLGKLEARWQDVVLPTMLDRGLLQEAEVEEFMAWFTPQLKKSPVPISTLFDFLWWMNFSMKWQHVTLRMLNRRERLSRADFDRLVHFYNHDDFQQWSMNNHHIKMLDKSKFPTAKWPLKQYIYAFTQDDDYLRDKIKIGSLTHSPKANFGIDANFNVIRFGGYSLSRRAMKAKYGDSLVRYALRGIPA